MSNHSAANNRAYQRHATPPPSEGRRRGMFTGDAQEWERDWRRGVERQLQQTAQANQQTAQANQQAAITLERINGRLDEYDRRLTTLEEARKDAPQETRAWLATANSSVGTLISLGGWLLAALAFLLQHASFH